MVTLPWFSVCSFFKASLNLL